jgi:hypothetical protein
MFRRSLCALATVAGLSIVPSANAQPPIVYASYPCHARVRVMYRGCGWEPWRVYATYWSDRQAHIAAHHLRARGFEVIVQGC